MITVEPGDTVQFTDESAGMPSSWSWVFEGGTPSTSDIQHPVVTYNNAGIYDVSLSVSNEHGSDIEIKAEFTTTGYSEITQMTFATVWRGEMQGGATSGYWFKIRNTTTTYGIYMSFGGYDEPGTLADCDYIIEIDNGWQYVSHGEYSSTGIQQAIELKSTLEANENWAGFDTIEIDGDELTFTVTEIGPVDHPFQNISYDELTVVITRDGQPDDIDYTIVTELNYLPASVTVEEATTSQLRVGNQYGQVITNDCIYESSNDYYATVNSTGRITGVNEGSAVITVTHSDGPEETVDVTINEPTGPVK